MSEWNLPADSIEVQRVLNYASRLANMKEVSVSIVDGSIRATGQTTDDRFINLLPEYINKCYTGDMFF